MKCKRQTHTISRNALCRRGADLAAALLFFLMFCAFAQTARATQTDLEVIVEGGTAVQFHIAKVVIPGLEEPRMQALMRAFTMTVRVDGEQVFRGTCDSLPQPLFTPRLLSMEEVMSIEIHLEFDKWADNSFQGIPYSMQFYFASQDAQMHQIMLSKKVFNVNGNVNPGDVLRYQVAVNRFHAGEHTTDSPFNPPTDPTAPSVPVTNEYNDTSPFNPPSEHSNIRTGGILEQAVTEHLDVVLVGLSALVIVCIVLVLTVPTKRRQEWQTQEQ